MQKGKRSRALLSPVIRLSEELRTSELLLLNHFLTWSRQDIVAISRCDRLAANAVTSMHLCVNEPIGLLTTGHLVLMTLNTGVTRFKAYPLLTTLALFTSGIKNAFG